MIWSIENLRGSVPHQEKEKRAGTATVRFSCQPLHAPKAVWELPEITVPFSVVGDVLEFGENFEAEQQTATELHDKNCPGHQGEHHFMVTAGFTYRV